ncbi:hypothetical protein N8J89_03840 [Crossiella sp. CA-258035]|uniref:hypothetical protein n=1 Tax=Crossiella sp. CA-258035 TaxID=2981138 RepID=UPI0024BD42C8|nr:hypothetical protein [Crossiella sp. CA-258035]WHT20216.1 hypothetical protein N8J89_03840 [Crossiella sp. CA-258035]
MIVLVSGKSAPGATTTVAALAHGWPAPLVLADCDPHGGDLATGWLSTWWLGGWLGLGVGVLSFVTATRHTTTVTADQLTGHLQAVPPAPHARLLAGLADPGQASAVGEAGWRRVAAGLSALAAVPRGGVDVLADCGRLSDGAEVPWPVLEAADLVLLAVRPVPRHIHAAQPALTALRQRIPGERLGLAVCGTSALGVRQLQGLFGVPARVSLPEDAEAARVFSDGAAHRKIARTLFGRVAARSAQRLRATTTTARSAPSTLAAVNGTPR